MRNSKCIKTFGIAVLLLVSLSVHANISFAQFSFAVFGDLNGGGCGKNQRAHEIVALMADTQGTHHPTVDFFLQTGDLIEGYASDDDSHSCFASDPGGCAYSGSVQDQLRPLLEKQNPAGLNATFFPVVGNHDYNQNWYPDPCGNTICDLLNLNAAGVYNTYINHGDQLQANGLYPHTLNNGDICEDADAYRTDFYYSFAYQNSYFIILNLNQDYYNMLSCHHTRVPDGYDGCYDYCSDEALLMDADRLSTCYRVYHYDWLVSELRKAQAGNYAHIFVFGHAPLLSSGDSHRPTVGAPNIRALLEQYGVDIYFNGHNHAYERTHPVRGNQIDATGTTYITAGTGGAAVNGNTGDWFTARRIHDWAQYWNYYPHTTSYVVITVEDTQVTGDVYTLDTSLTPSDTDHFILGTALPSCADQGGTICGSGQTCNGNEIGSSDSGVCCVGTCETIDTGDGAQAEQIIDNADAGYSESGNWETSSGTGSYGSDSRFSDNAGDTASWQTTIQQAGQYDISAWWTYYDNRHDAVPYSIYVNGSSSALDTVTINQLENGGQWNLLGTYNFNANDAVEVRVSVETSDSSTCADAVKFVRAENGDTGNNGSGGGSGESEDGDGSGSSSGCFIFSIQQL